MTRPVEPHPEDFCHRCGVSPLPSWHAPSPLWNAVMRSPRPEPFSGIVCPNCFAALANSKGVTDHLCVTTHERELKVTLPTVFGDGRVWDAEQCRWVEPAPVEDDYYLIPEHGSELTREEFERRRNCSHCGQRLTYVQYSVQGAQMLTKRCPRYDEWREANPAMWLSSAPFPSRHDFLEHRHAFPYHNRRGQRSDGTKRALG
jgi:hypothetical protein